MNNRDLICLSHLRWNFVFQRPQHLMTRFGTHRRVYFLEEPTYGSAEANMSITRAGTVRVLTPQLPHGTTPQEATVLQRRMLRDVIAQDAIEFPVLWFYTPLMLPLADGIHAAAIVYDCMDELSAFKNAPPELAERERELLARADVVFTGGQSLYEAKRDRHPRVHAFPSSVDVPHFSRARAEHEEPIDQASIPRPRIGYCGVIDERMDLELIRGVAERRPDWHIVMIGPTAKIEDSALPRAANIHYLGMKKYEELPQYLAGWDVAMLPFARNEATRFISPTKTPEYLAAGRPVVATSVRDVVRPYGEKQLVRIADDTDAFVKAAAAAIEDGGPPKAAETFINAMSWDRTWAAMNALVEEAVQETQAPLSATWTPLHGVLPPGVPSFAPGRP